VIILKGWDFIFKIKGVIAMAKIPSQKGF